MTRIIPYFAETATATIVIDGVTYRVPLIDDAGHLQVDVVTSTLPALAATSGKQDTMITALQLIDDLRGALDAVKADRLNVNAFATGASEVKAASLRSVDPSTTRATIATPTSGKKIRLVSCQVWNGTTVASVIEVYFGTGADITINAGKEIAEPRLLVDKEQSFGMVWPDGGGPVGAVNDVVSLRTSANITNNCRILIHYREE